MKYSFRGFITIIFLQLWVGCPHDYGTRPYQASESILLIEIHGIGGKSKNKNISFKVKQIWVLVPSSAIY